MCPEETFTNYNFTEFCDNCHRHFAHEDMRYGSYFFHYYWVDKYGIDAVANVWRSARKPGTHWSPTWRLTGSGSTIQCAGL